MINKRNFLLILLFLPLAILAQQPAKLSGTLTDADLKKVTVVQDNLFLAGEATHSGEVRNGKFSIELDLNAPQPVTLKAGEQTVTVFLAPGEDLQLSLNGADAEGINFTGKAAPQNIYLQEFLTANRIHFDVDAMEERVLTTPIDVLELDLYAQRRKQNKALDVAFTGNKYSQAFRDYMRNEVAYAYDRWLLAYPILRANANPKSLEVKHLPRVMEQGIDEKMLVSESALASQTYRDYVWYYMIYFTSKTNGFKKFTDFNNSVNKKSDYATSHLKGKVLTWYLTRLLAKNCNKIAPGTVDRMRTTIKKGTDAGPYLKAAAEICEEADKERIASNDAGTKKGKKKKNKKSKKMSKKGPEKYDFRMVSLEGEEMKMSDFAGKVVYIDFWASWCGPCRGQMPFSKKLHHKLEEELSGKEEKDIVFLYISIDQDEAAWRKGIDAMQIEGTHAFSNARWPDGAGNFFQIPGIPRYMVMDKNGDIVDMNAKRPSMDGIYEQLIDLVKQ